MQIAISRQTDAQHLNSILNHPEVLPLVSDGSSDTLDMTPVMESPDVIALYGEHGGQVYHRLQPGLFEAHSAFKPEGRGEWALAATRQTLKWIFTHTEAVEIVTRVPAGNVAARALAKAIGGVHEFTLPGGWVKDGKPIPADVFSLTIQGWMKSSPDLPSRGKWFHGRLNAELDRLGIAEPPHDDDETHDRYVGAACEMMFGGQPDKACIFYNRVASLARWHPIAILDYEPLVVNIGSAILVMRGDDFIAIPPPKPAQ
jgi:hypothetical protein